VVRFLASRALCKNGSECREQDCCFGDVCDIRTCEHGGAKYCRLGRLHDVDPTVAEWIEGISYGHNDTSGWLLSQRMCFTHLLAPHIKLAVAEDGQQTLPERKFC